MSLFTWCIISSKKYVVKSIEISPLREGELEGRMVRATATVSTPRGPWYSSLRI
jgi:hypothetical protein